jgi:hypothetical protein
MSAFAKATADAPAFASTLRSKAKGHKALARAQQLQKRWRFANALPEPDFKYLSNTTARFFAEKAI